MANIASTTASAGTEVTARALRESVFAGLITLGLFVLFVGLKTDQNIRNELILTQRWGLLAIFVIIAMVGRFLMVAYVQPRLAQRKAAKAAAPEVAKEESFFSRNFSTIAILALILYPPVIVALTGVQGSLKWVDNFGIQILIYVMLAWGLNIVVGLAGLLDLGYVAFYAVGAYSYALLSTYLGLSFWVLLPVAGLLAACWGVVLGFPVLRLRGDYLAIVTLAFGEIIRLVLINWTEVTKGTFGVSGIAKATLFGIKFDASKDGFAALMGLPISSVYYKIFLFYLILGLCLITAFVTIRMRRMPIGRAWEALREDEIACKSLGINTVTTKLTAFAMGAMFGGIAGSFFAVRQGFVSPESFVFLESAVILAIVVLGGMGSLTGIAIAAIVMIGGTEILRELDFLKAVFGPNFTPELYRMLIFGLAMVVVMVWKPRGFVGSREPTAFLRERKAVSGSFTKEGHG
ncbi:MULTISPECIES: high-affinity branched-chain amino acid ABC transporter permease LivM [Sinorhizobium/Ensifer group]|jgi:branched-chain amino acid transport system permease protein|uniref:high-affinity branched-chain amino acid ABC transporter permease LivM n=1 Tax=Sinorhizobium/Ensifer group TaxID=227292 RepID=UPI00070D0219|nr:MULTISPECIES: high-affinity branched-chain amino acid ABC transporter permease LivM [Sinorhizobium/Ensifer group]KRD69791.1 ABC transporter permease [Ensifer sp. Root278]KSV79477.1 ABC transporter permease [Sinorhizobium sp. Sb3]KSV94956.1 ABC transporter permease [Sinorhizobium sp. GL28]MBD9507704.1 high-affinity branched-chain amino acid ABC transporter permease LivM [Ensifer sp. ENS10]MBV7519513.1 high-affinity branched-chain amino acid ABC transporter permease LivM [Ensifer sp. ENS12]